MRKMLEEINRDRFSAWCEWVMQDFNWDALGATYIAVGLFIIIVAVCTHEETKTRTLSESAFRRKRRHSYNYQMREVQAKEELPSSITS